MAWPTTSDPRTEFVTLRLTVAEAAALDLMCAATGQSRSTAVREAVGDAVTRHARKTAQKAQKQTGAKP